MQRSNVPSKRRRDWAGTAAGAALIGGVAAMIGSGARALPIGPYAVQTSNGTTPSYVGNPSTGVSGVNLTAPRTILDWTSFNIAQGETVTFNANARSDIVLNRVGDFAQVQINGTLNSLVGTQTGGNVWISSPGGIIFGPTAVVNVGGLLATSTTLTDPADFLDPTKSSFSFQFYGEGTFDPAGTSQYPYYGGVVVQPGARLSTSKGLLALVAPFVTVQSGAAVGDANTGDALIGGVAGYTITLGQETAGDLDLLEFQIPVSSGNFLSGSPGGDTPVAPSVTVAGSVTGKNVYVTALSLQSLTNAIVTDNGSVTANGAVQQGNGTVILTADTIDLVPASYPNGSIYDPTSGVAPTSGSNLFLPQYATPLSFGAINAPQTYIHGGGLVGQSAGTTFSGGGTTISAGDIALAAASLTGSFRAAAQPLPAAQYINVTTPPGGTVSATGPITANDIDILAASAISTGALTAAGGPVVLSSSGGPVTAGIITAAGGIDLAATAIAADGVDAGGMASLIATPGSSTSPGAAGVQVGGLTAPKAFVQAGDGLVAITSANMGSGGLEARALGPSGDIWLGYASITGLTSPLGQRLAAVAFGGGGGTGTLGGAASLYADHNVNVDVATAGGLSVVKAGNQASLTAETGDLPLGTVAVAGGLTAAAPHGSISLPGLQLAGLATLSAGSDITLNVEPAALTGSAQAGRDLTVTGAGALDLTGFSLSAGRNATLSSPGLLSLAGLTAGDAIQVVAGDLSLQGALTAPTVTIGSSSGPLTLGGGGTGTGLVLDSTEFGRISAASALNLYAGAPTGVGRGDLTALDLAIDPAKTPALNLYAAAGHTVSIQDLAAPTRSGGAITVGGVAGWTPTTILVTGELGTAMRVSDTQFSGVRAFGQVSLTALGDILLGSPRFIGIVQAAARNQINLALGLPAGVQPQGSEIGRVYLASGRLALAAGGKVVGQNTSGGLGGYSGVYLTNTPGTPGVVLTLDPPSVVDLFGSYATRTGATASGPPAAIGPDLKVLAATNALDYRFNGCIIGVGCSSSILPGPAQGLQPLNALQAVFVSDATDANELAGAAEGAESTGAPGARVQPPTFNLLPSTDADAQADPVVTGTGNEEIWRQRGGSSQ